MGNKQAVPSLYNASGIDENSKIKTGKDREIPEDPSPKTYHIPNHITNDELDYLKIITWNVNMEAHSAYAPKEWSSSHDKWELVYSQCQAQNADIISFQEIPTKYTEEQQSEDIHPLIRKYIESKQWHITWTKASHSGYTIILVHSRLEQKFEIEYDDDIDPLQRFPGIRLWTKSKPKKEEKEKEEEEEEERECKLLLFGCHLHPFGGDVNASKRRQQFDRLHKIAVDQGVEDHFVLIGDTNMRYQEERDIIDGYQGTVCCGWDIVPNDLKKNGMFTWYRNYFSVGARGTSRYDKIFHGLRIKCIELSVFDEKVSDDKYHFLSDHRAVSVLIEIH